MATENLDDNNRVRNLAEFAAAIGVPFDPSKGEVFFDCPECRLARVATYYWDKKKQGYIAACQACTAPEFDIGELVERLRPKPACGEEAARNGAAGEVETEPYDGDKVFGGAGMPGGDDEPDARSQSPPDSKPKSKVAELVRECIAADPVAAYARVLGDGEPFRRGNEHELHFRCRQHDDQDPSGRLDPDKGVWFCDPCDKGGDLFNLYQIAHNCDFKTALTALAALFNVTPSNGHAAPQAAAKAASKKNKPASKKNDWEIVWPIPARYVTTEVRAPQELIGEVDEDNWILHPYRTAGGKDLFYVVRFKRRDNGKKEIRPLSFWGSDKYARENFQWWWPPKPFPLYGLDRLAAQPDAPVLIVAGEKCVDAAVARVSSWVATTWSGGEGKPEDSKWDDVKARPAPTVIWPDNDRKGADAALKVAGILGAENVRIVVPKSEWREKYDVADLIADGATTDEIEAIIDAAVDVETFRAEAAKRWPETAKPAQSSQPDSDADDGRIYARDARLIKELHKQLWKAAEEALKEAQAENPKTTKSASDFLPYWDAAYLERVIVTDLGHRFSRNHGEDVFQYRAGFYQPDGQNYIRRLVKAIIIPDAKWTSHHANEAVERITIDSPYILEELPR